MKHEEKAREITEYVMIDPIVRVGSGELEHVIAAALREAYERGLSDCEAIATAESARCETGADAFPAHSEKWKIWMTCGCTARVIGEAIRAMKGKA